MNIKIEYKIALLVIFLLIFLGLSFGLYKSNLTQISQKIENLNNNNDKLQQVLIYISNIETLNKNVTKFLYMNDDYVSSSISELNDKINIDTDKFKNDPYLASKVKKINFFYREFSSYFNIAKIHIPKNFSFRKDVRRTAQLIEDKIDSIKLKNKNENHYLNLILLKKYILEVEKALARYFETDDATYVLKARENLNKVKYMYKKVRPDVEQHKEFLNKQLDIFDTLVNQTIVHYRTYSMLTKVVLPGHMLEISHHIHLTKEYVQREIYDTKGEIQTLLDINNKDINYFFSLIVIFIIFAFYLFYKIIFKNLYSVTNMFEKIINKEKNILVPTYTTNDAIGKLIYAAVEFKKLNNTTNELLMQTNNYKKNLEQKVVEELELRREQEKALIQQSKLASMGEMIGAIAHQWRQPLNELSIRIQKLKYNYEKDEIDAKFISNFIQKNKNTIDFMSKTIDDFRNFFRIDKEKKEFYVREAIDEVLNIQGAQLKNHGILVEIRGDDFNFNGHRSEFQQVILNIISNSKDAFISNNIKDPKIDITLDKNTIFIQDNAGGIQDEIIDRVFEPYFTTKEQGEGTGMGLYMSKMIIEDNMNGKINIQNKNDGVITTVKFER